MSEQPEQKPPEQPTAPPPAPIKSKRKLSRAERFLEAAEEVLAAADEADDALKEYVEAVDTQLSELNDAIQALNDQLAEQAGLIEDALSNLREVRDEYQEQFDDMGERAQQGERGQLLEAITQIDLEPSLPDDVEFDTPENCESPDYDPVRDAAQACLDADLPQR